MNGSIHLLCAAALLSLAACQSPPEPAAAAPASEAPKPLPSPLVNTEPNTAWLGKWTGPEGTSLTLAQNGARVAVTIVNLDGPSTYDGVWADGQVVFARGGMGELIRAGNGVDTGMKWLAEKRNCLVVREGEGYCRD